MMQEQTGNGSLFFENGVRRLTRCSLMVGGGVWLFAEENRYAIDAHWTEAAKNNPGYFNGVVHLVQEVKFESDRFEASFVKTDFKSYLYWRALGFPDAGVLDGFGSALIRSSDCYIMLGVQRMGNVNGGLAYPPAGFIDEQDVQTDGSIDIAKSVAREVSEETGIESATLARGAEIYLTRSRSFQSPFLFRSR